MLNKNGREMNNSKRRRKPEPSFTTKMPRGMPMYTRSTVGSKSCRCGRTISANKATCLPCS